MDLLPNDVSVVILEKLAVSPTSVAALAATCSRLHSLSREFGLLQGPSCLPRRCQNVWKGQAWREELQMAVRSCEGRPSSQCNLDLSCYFSPTEDEVKSAHMLATDGTQLVLYDRRLHFMRGWAPPQVHGPGTPRHLQHNSSPVTISSSLPSYRALDMLLLHPHLPLPPDSGSLLSSPWPPQHFHHPSLPLPPASPSRAVPLGGLRKVPHSSPSPSSAAPAEKAGPPSASSPRAAAAPAASHSTSSAAHASAAEAPALQGLSLVDSDEGHGHKHGHKEEEEALAFGGSIVVLPEPPPPQSISSSSLLSSAARSGAAAQSKAAPVAAAAASAAAQSAASLMLTRAPCLHNATYLDVSYHSNLSDTDLAVLLSKCRGLKHLALAGTQAGPHALSQLGKQSLHNLQALDLSHHCAIGTHMPPPPRHSSSAHHAQPFACLPPRPRPNPAGHGMAEEASSSSSSSSSGASSPARDGPSADGCRAGGSSSHTQRGVAPSAPPEQSPCANASKVHGGLSTPELVSGHLGSWGLRHRHPSVLAAQLEQGSADPSSSAHPCSTRAGSSIYTGSPDTSPLHGSPNDAGYLLTEAAAPAAIPSSQPQTQQAAAAAAAAAARNPQQQDTCPRAQPGSSAPALHAQGSACSSSHIPRTHGSRQYGSDGERGHCSNHSSSSRLSLDGASMGGVRGARSGLKVEGRHKEGGGAAASTQQKGSSWEGGQHAVFVRLLRSTLERLPDLKDLRLCGNHLGGLFDPLPFSPSRHQAHLPQQQHAPASLILQSLSKLERLHLSGSTGVCAQNLALILQHCPNLKELNVSGCTDLTAAVSGESLAELLLPLSSAPSPPAPALPVLRRLQGGWGLCAPSLETLVCHPGRAHALTALELGVGAGVSDAFLATLGASCTNLQELKLTLAPISDEGVRPLLMGCRKLHVLHLIHCLGPFSPALLPSKPSALDYSDSSDHRWTLSSLQILGSRCTLNSGQLMQLIGARPNTLHALALANCPFITPALLNFLGTTHPSLQHIRLEQCGGYSWDHRQWGQCSTSASCSSNNTHPGPAAASVRNPDNISSDSASTSTVATSNACSFASSGNSAQGQQDTHTPSVATHAVPASCASTSPLSAPGGAAPSALVEGTRSTPLLNTHNQPHAPAAQNSQPHLHAASPCQPDSHCISNQPSPLPTSSCSHKAPPPAQRPSASVWPLTEASVTKLAQACPGLRSVRIRHCCQFGAGILETLTDLCPLLTSVLLDRCDLADNGMRCPQSSFHPLHMIMVARCQYLEPYSALLTPLLSRLGAAAHVKGGHRLDASVLIHDLSAGKTSVLHEAAGVR